MVFKTVYFVMSSTRWLVLNSLVHFLDDEVRLCSFPYQCKKRSMSYAPHSCLIKKGDKGKKLSQELDYIELEENFTRDMTKPKIEALCLGSPFFC